MITIKRPYNRYEHAYVIIEQFITLYDTVFTYDENNNVYTIRPLSSMPYIEPYDGQWHECILYMLNVLENKGHVTYIDPDGTTAVELGVIHHFEHRE